MDQIDCYQNVRTKLTVILKYKDQNDIFTKKLNHWVLNQRETIECFNGEKIHLFDKKMISQREREND